MKIKGWAVFGGCYAKGLGNSRVHRSTWNTLSSAKYFMLSTCCMALNELWGGRKGDLPCKVFKGNANPDTHTHRNTHSSQWSYTHSSSSSRAMAFFFFFSVNILALKKSKLEWEQESGVNGVSLKKLSLSLPPYSAPFLPRILISAGRAREGEMRETLWTNVSGREVSSGQTHVNAHH